MLLPVPEIVFPVMPLGLARIVILVLHLPVDTTRKAHLGHSIIAQGVIGGKRIVIRHFAVPLSVTGSATIASFHPERGIVEV